MNAVDLLLGAALTVLIAWVALLGALLAFRPRDMSVADARRVVPDVAHLVRGLAADSALPRGLRWRLWALLAYLASPIDLVPDFIPMIGYADDVIVVAVVLRSVTRRAGPEAVERHWTGTPQGLALLRRLCRLKDDA